MIDLLLALLLYIVIPFGIPYILVQYIGFGVFIFYPIWLYLSYRFLDNSAKEREAVNFMEHTDVIGWGCAFVLPSLISAIIFLIYLLVYVVFV